jgi:hypothetical protein
MADDLMRPISQVWMRRLDTIGLPTDATVVEVAPGEEPKIGTALAGRGFVGALYIVEPDETAAHAIHRTYTELLPHATIEAIAKPLQDVRAGTDVPPTITTLVANHAFDDMVMSSILGHTSCPDDEPYPFLTLMIMRAVLGPPSARGRPLSQICTLLLSS